MIKKYLKSKKNKIKIFNKKFSNTLFQLIRHSHKRSVNLFFSFLLIRLFIYFVRAKNYYHFFNCLYNFYFNGFFRVFWYSNRYWSEITCNKFYNYRLYLKRKVKNNFFFFIFVPKFKSKLIKISMNFFNKTKCQNKDILIKF